MKTKIKNLIVGIFVVIGIALTLGFNYLDKKDDFSKKQDCSQHYELAHSKIKDSSRVFQNESYDIDELFYSKKYNSCLYAFKIYANPQTIYGIYDVFGGSILDTTVESAYFEKIKELK